MAQSEMLLREKRKVFEFLGGAIPRSLHLLYCLCKSTIFLSPSKKPKNKLGHTDYKIGCQSCLYVFKYVEVIKIGIFLCSRVRVFNRALIFMSYKSLVFKFHFFPFS